MPGSDATCTPSPPCEIRTVPNPETGSTATGCIWPRPRWGSSWRVSSPTTQPCWSGLRSSRDRPDLPPVPVRPRSRPVHPDPTEIDTPRPGTRLVVPTRPSRRRDRNGSTPTRNHRRATRRKSRDHRRRTPPTASRRDPHRRCRHSHRNRRPHRHGPLARPIPTACQSRAPDSTRTPQRRVCVPRLSHTTRLVRRPPRDPLATRWHHRTGQPVAVVPTPPPGPPPTAVDHHHHPRPASGLHHPPRHPPPTPPTLEPTTTPTGVSVLNRVSGRAPRGDDRPTPRGHRGWRRWRACRRAGWSAPAR
jgi:hypothetical protein